MKRVFPSSICVASTASAMGPFTRGGTYGGMYVSEAKRLKWLEDESARLKQLLADA
jgi:hypothetical protein